MAIILKTHDLKPNVCEPVMYVDSNNADSYISEMMKYILNYIKSNSLNNNCENYIAQSSNDIYYNKADGYWVIYDEKAQILSLYIKDTNKGYVYNSVNIKKVFSLTYKLCPKTY